MSDVFDKKESEDLDYVNSKRRQVIEFITADNKIPNDPEAIGLLLGALNDMDRTAIAKARVRISSKEEENNSNNSLLLTELLKNLKSPAVEAGAVRELPPIPSSVEVTELVEGETVIENETFTYDEFFNADPDDPKS